MSDSSKSRRKSILLLIIVASVIVLIICAILLTLYSVSGYRESLKNASLKDMIGESSLVLSQDFETLNLGDSSSFLTSDAAAERPVISKYEKLHGMNPDFVGWISIDGTKVDYPVMQTVADETYYLYRNFYKEDSKSGCPFMDIRCIPRIPSTNLIIYGHNMKNGDMFADLLKYENKSYCDKHKYIRFDTIYEEALYEVVAVFRTRVAFKDENTFKFYNFIEADTVSDFNDFYTNIKSMSLYETDSDVSASDFFITLATCEYTVEDGRFVVVAKRIVSKGE